MMINKKWAVVLIILMAVGCAQDEKINKDKETLIKVDTLTVSLAEFNDAYELSQMLSEQPQSSDPLSEQTDRLQFMRQLLEEMVILRRADELNLTVPAQELEKEIDKIRKDYPDDSFDEIFLKEAISYDHWKEKIRKRLLVKKVIQTDLVQNISITAEEIKSYYNEHKETFGRPEMVRVYQILLPTDDQAKEVLAEINRGSSFQDMARTHSTSPDKDKGGDLGFVAKGILPEVLDKAIFKLKEGKISPVVKSGYGYHLFLVTEKKPASKPDLSRVTKTIRTRLKEEKLEQVYGAWLAKLRSRYEVEVNDNLLE
jgi:parvulin-like peptidyl-prolyl isomerase